MAEFTITMAQVSPKSKDDGAMDAKAILQMRREMKGVFGWKKDYGKLTSTDAAKKKREDAEVLADRFIRNCALAFGADAAVFDKMMAEFDKIRKDFGWKEDYGKLTSTAKASEKREEAERKAEDMLARMSS
mmetsp:Transcript_2545/g.5548  ORF Transcript_2545/g.5548 Transcript_2545/m.5548 type:complete len:131 (+) Transcript_2545:208-600(+)